MKKLYALVQWGFIAIIAIAFSIEYTRAQTVFISEIHYDNSGTDSGEGFEIFAPAGTDLSCYQIILYNGSGGAAYNTINLSGTAGDEGCGFDAIWTGLPVDGMQNGAPDGIALYNTCTSTLIQFLSYEGSFTATSGPANGIGSTDIGVTETGTTPVGQSLQLSGTGTTYGDFSWNSPAAGSTGTINSGMDPCAGCSGPVPQPTTETTADSATPTCTSSTITWTSSTTADNVIVVVSTGAIGSTPTDGISYTGSTTFGSGETIGAGQFVVYNGNGTTVTVSGLTPGTTYNYAIFGYDGTQVDCEENYLTGGNFGSFTTLTGCSSAQITSLMINSCNGTSEGTDELIIIENGSEPINVDDIIIDLPNTTWCNSCVGGDGLIVNNATYVSDLNAMAGCVPDLFVYADPIPAGATIIIFTGNPPSTVLDYSSNCGAPGAPMYVLFLDNSSITGNFANSGTVTKIIDIDFGNGQTDVVSYYPDDVANVDGGSVNYDDAGNPTYYTSLDCVYPLAARLGNFSAVRNEAEVNLTWTTLSESFLESFQVERSSDGINFTPVGGKLDATNTDGLKNYSSVDYWPESSTWTYYRLCMISMSGQKTYSDLVAIQPAGFFVYYSSGSVYLFSGDDEFSAQHYSIYSLDGSMVKNGLIDSENLIIPFSEKGIFIVDLPESEMRFKITCF